MNGFADKELPEGKKLSDRLAQRHILTRRFRRLPQLAVVLVLIGLAWRVVRYALCFPLWGDEGFVAINFLVRHDYADMLKFPLEYHQICPVLFMWGTLAVTKLLGTGEYALRLLPFVAGIASLLIFWRFAYRILDRHSALLATGILAVSFYPVRHATELKPYAIDLLVGLCLTYVAWWISRKPVDILRWLILTATTVFCVWLSYPTAFIAAGLGIYLLWQVWRNRSAKALAGLAIFGVCSVASLYAMLVLYAGPQSAASPQYTTIDTWLGAFPPVLQPWRLPWWIIEIHTGNMLAYPAGGNHFASTGTFLLVIAGFVHLWRSGRRDVLLLLLAPLIPLFAAAAMKKYPYGTSARIALFMAPAFCLLAGAGLAAVLRWTLPKRLAGEGVRVAALVLATFGIVALVLNVAMPYKTLANYQNRLAAEDIAAKIRPGDQAIVANVPPYKNTHAPILTGTDAVTFRYYLMRWSPVPVRFAPLPKDISPVAGTTWVIYMTAPKEEDRELREGLFAAYFPQIKAALGGSPAKHFHYAYYEPDKKFKATPPTVEVYEFPGRAGN